MQSYPQAGSGPTPMLRWSVWLMGLLLMLSLAQHRVALPGQAPTGSAANNRNADAARQTKVQADYGNQPLRFEANKGQADPGVDFVARGSGFSLSLSGGNATLGLHAGGAAFDHRGSAPLQDDGSASRSTIVQMHVLGATPQARAEIADVLPSKANSFVGNDPSRWRTDLPTSATVRYTNVYPGVDLVYHGTQGRLEYDFILAPGADPSSIALAVAGGGTPRLAGNGDLIMALGSGGSTPAGELRQTRPVIYQELGGVRRPVTGSFVLARDGQTVSFDVGAYDHGQALVIDPVMVFSTTFGGSGGDTPDSSASDADGNTYLTGITFSSDFATLGGFPATPRGGGDVFVVKLDPSGTVLYSAVFGGSKYDAANGIAVDSSGSAYVTGTTFSTDFPTTHGVYQPSFTPSGSFGYTSFVAKLNPSGNGLAYATYLGDAGNDTGAGIAVDAAGNAYTAGGTSLGNGGGDVSVNKLNPSGTALVYNKTFGGSGLDYANAIAVHTDGSVVVAGKTFSADFPVTADAQQPKLLGTAGNGFWAEFSPAGGSAPSQSASATGLPQSGLTIAAASYLGSGASHPASDDPHCRGNNNSGDEVDFVAIDKYGYTTIAATVSGPVPAVWVKDAFLPSYGGGNCDGFVSRLGPITGELGQGRLVYGTYLGSSGDDCICGLALGAAGNAYVTGQTWSGNFPAKGISQPYHGNGDAYLTVLYAIGQIHLGAKTLNRLLYSTTLGTADAEEAGTGVGVDGCGNVNVSGYTRRPPDIGISEPTDWQLSTTDVRSGGRVIGGAAPHRASSASPGGAICGFVTDGTGQMGGYAAASVTACLGGGACLTTSTDGRGQYEFDGLAAGTYNVEAVPAAAPAGQAAQGATASAAVRAIPNGCSGGGPGGGALPLMEVVTATAGGRAMTNFSLVAAAAAPGTGTGCGLNGTVNTAGSFDIYTSECGAGGANYTISAVDDTINHNGSVILAQGSMAAGAGGTYTATVPSLAAKLVAVADALPKPIWSGLARLRITCNGSPSDDLFYIDPSGFVRTPSGALIAGATVTLTQIGSGGSGAVVPNGSAIMSPSNQRNPDKTDTAGSFGWNVLPGQYQVTASKPGCTAVAGSTSAVLTVPPPVLNLVLTLNCPLGDVNGDGSVNAVDALCVLRSVVTLPATAACPTIPLTAPSVGLVATDGSTQVTAVDALCILRWVAGLLGTAVCPALPTSAASVAAAGRAATAVASLHR
ncbi:MAG: SBBP repeat-containing protein [Dehalococcoidia bacterium]